MSTWLSRLLGQGDSTVPLSLRRRPWDPDGSPDDFVDLCFRIVLGRIPEPRVEAQALGTDASEQRNVEEIAVPADRPGVE